jgi:hypothetical protein
VSEVAVGKSGGIALYYRLGDPTPLRDRRQWRPDDRGRTALEAFTALPLAEMYRRLQAGDAEWRAIPEPERAAALKANPDRESARWLAAFRELVSFVVTFGPLGLDWSRRFEVEVPQADALERRLGEMERRELEGGLGRKAGTELSQRFSIRGDISTRVEVAPHQLWELRFPDVGEAGVPQVRKQRSWPDLPWADRLARGDDSLPHDFLGPVNAGPLYFALDSLRHALALADALAAEDGAQAQGALRGYPWLAALDFHAPAAPPWDSLTRDWRTAVSGPVWDRNTPWKIDAGRVDWLTIGRMVLAATLTQQLWWAAPRIGFGPRDTFTQGWRVGSLMEVIYFQLLEHVLERVPLGLGIAECGYCGGAVLKVRRGQRWHSSACANAGRQRRYRERQATEHENAGPDLGGGVSLDDRTPITAATSRSA